MDRFFAPDFDVQIEGLVLEADVRGAVADLTVQSSVETAGMATIRLHDPKLKLIDSALFEPGKVVDIHLGYAGDLKPVFLGEIAAIQPSFPSNGAPGLTVTAYDKSHAMRHNTPARPTFKAMNDAAIVARLALENLLIPRVIPSILPPIPDQSIQQTDSDWALIKKLADRNGYDAFVARNDLHFRPPLPVGEIISLERGRNLSSYSPRLSTAGASLLQVARGYDADLDQTVVSFLTPLSMGSDLDDIIERLGSKALGQLKKLGRHLLRDQPANSFIEANVLAKVAITRLLDGFYEARGSCVGIPEMHAGEFVDIRGVGKRYSGTFRLSSVTHSINGSGYRTSFQIKPTRTGSLIESLRHGFQDQPSPNKQDKIFAPMVAKVATNYHPLRPAQVQVTLPELSDDNRSAWARMVSPLAGDDAGTYFLPDVGDEVLVVFENGEVDKPRVLGGAWNGKQRPPTDAVSPQNSVKMIRTKAGHTIKLDDSSGSEEVSIVAKNGSKLVIDATGDITVDSVGSVILVSEGGPIELGAKKASDKASLDSSVQAELKKLRETLNSLITAYNTHIHPASAGTTSATTSLATAPAAVAATASKLVTIKE